MSQFAKQSLAGQHYQAELGNESKLCLVMPASQARLGEGDTLTRYQVSVRGTFSKQSFEDRHYQAELGSELMVFDNHYTDISVYYVELSPFLSDELNDILDLASL